MPVPSHPFCALNSHSIRNVLRILPSSSREWLAMLSSSLKQPSVVVFKFLKTTSFSMESSRYRHPLAGSGTISCPPAGHTFFLPQKPYMPLGSLRQQLLFPKDESNKMRPSDEELLTALEEVRFRVDRKLLGSPASHLWSAYRFVHPQL
jgi:hypothetical protein